MYEYCKSCVHDKGDIGFCDKCGYTYMLRKRGLPPTEYEAKQKPITNADRIRAMTDEELADWLNNDVEYWDKWCHDDAPVDQETLVCLRSGGECRLCILDWLKEEASE